LQPSVEDDSYLKPGSECILSTESVWGAGSGSTLGFGHCWGAVGEKDAGLNGGFGLFDEVFDGSYSSYLNYAEQRIFSAPYTEPQLEPLSILLAPPHIFSSLEDVAALTDGILLPTSQRDQSQEYNESGGLSSPLNVFLAGGFQSGTNLGMAGQSSDPTGENYQLPFLESTPLGSATGGELKTPSDTSTAAIRCDFKGCGRPCKDHESLRHHRRHHVKPFSCQEGSCASAIRSFCTRRDLERHQASAHRKGSLHCPHCRITINGNRLDNLKRHIKKLHGRT